MSDESILQKVIDYEFHIVQQEMISEYTSSKTIPNAKRFTQWNLMRTIKKIPQYFQYNLLWVGNDRTTHIICFFYCVMLGSLQSSDKLDQAFLKVKFYLYQLSSEFLSIDQQKIFVQNICLIQYSKSLAEFLKKNQSFEDLLAKIFMRYHKKHSPSGINEDFQPFQELKLFSKILQFAKFEKVDERIGMVSIKNCSFYIVQELDCFFILEEKNISSIKKMVSQSREEVIYKTYRKRSSKKRKLNTPHSGYSSPKIHPDHSTPKFFMRSSQQNMSHSSRQNEMKVGIWREPQQSSGQKSFFNLTKIQDKNMFPHFTTLNSLEVTKASSPKNKQNIFHLPNLNDQNPRPRSKLNQYSLKENCHKQQYYNPETTMNKLLNFRDKGIVQSLGVNQIKEYRKIIPLGHDKPEQKQKRSIPKFILEKQEKKRANQYLSQRNLTQISPFSPFQKINANTSPKISSKVFPNSDTLVSPSQYLFTYHIK